MVTWASQRFALAIAIVFCLDGALTQAAEICKLRIYSPRPLADAALAIAEDFGEAISYEEALYDASHELRSLVPNGADRVPASTKLVFDYSRNGNAQEAVAQAVTAAARSVPERYAFRASANGALAILPAAEKQPTLPLDTPVDLGAGAITTRAAIDQLVNRINQAVPHVEVRIGGLPVRIAEDVRLNPTLAPRTGRDLLSYIAAEWTARGGGDKQFFTWHLRFVPEDSSLELKVYVLAFFSIERIRPGKGSVFLVESEHPIADAATLLENHYRVPIIVEEPAARCPCNLLGGPAPANTGLSGGSVKLRWNENETLPDVLRRLLDSDRRGDNNSGKELYDLELTRRGAVIKAARMRNTDGNVIPYAALLDSNLSRQLQSASASLSVPQICELLGTPTAQVAAAQPTAVDASIATLTLRNDKQPNTTLAKLLDTGLGANDGNVSFRLLYDPTIQGHRLIAKRLP